MPQLWIVAGPNGAGKTTVADRWLASRIPVVSPDSIAAEQGLSPIQAAKAAIREQERLLAAGADFAIDTTFSGNREIALMKQAADAGYKVSVLFICVEDLEVCQGRVLERIENGRVKHLSGNLPHWAKEAIPPGYQRTRGIDF
jgi:predicted ABC-type ATPase